MSESPNPLRSARLLILSLVVVIVVLGAALMVMAIGRSGEPATQEKIARIVAMKRLNAKDRTPLGRLSLQQRYSNSWERTKRRFMNTR